MTNQKRKGNTLQDPFANAPVETEAPEAEAQEESVFDAPPPEAPKKAPAKKAAPKKAEPKVTNVVAASEGKVVLTFKGGTGFDAPWIVIHANDLDDALDQVTGDNAATLGALFERVQNAGQHFAGLGNSSGQSNGGGNRGGGNGGGQRRSNAPREAQQPPADAPPAPGPDWVYKSGKKKNGNGTWQAWMPPRGSNEDPVWF
ncbi:hypothetical protein PBI_PHANTASTIC_51 [Mycobacterium phage Phantastic]|uniref:Uncharacterized protein n=1 Tax=Mycobacterium phage Phantastic TaxID=1486426 RepID=A0A023W6Y4_9CAUD|nr:ribonucleoside reductase class II [Mycobacterium phage Phantastic]AHY27114.1 hypothetical protein PBI_PHANTASTIC_51 [Mycobacterium phage Phantastic]